MQLCILRQASEIPIDKLTNVSKKIGATLNISPTPVEQPVANMDLQNLLEVSNSFLEQGNPVVAVVFTTSMLLSDQTVLGEGVQQSRGAWVRWSGNENKAVQAAVHEIGHICEAGHCAKKSCLMYPYYVPLPIDNVILKSLVCESCLRVITESWVYNRLISSKKAQERSVTDGDQISSKIPVGASTIQTRSDNSKISKNSFPDWSLPKNEFIEQVKEFFGYG